MTHYYHDINHNGTSDEVTVNVMGTPIIITILDKGIFCSVWNATDDAPITDAFLPWEKVAAAMGVQEKFQNPNNFSPA